MLFVLLPPEMVSTVAALESLSYTTYDGQALSFVSYLSKIFLLISAHCLNGCLSAASPATDASGQTSAKNKIGPALVRWGRLRFCFIVRSEDAYRK